MARGLTFHYCPGASPLHRWDARCKLPGLAIVTLPLLHMGTNSLILFSCILAIASATARLPWKPLLVNMKPWLVFILAIFLMQILFHRPSSPGSFSLLPSLNGIRAAATVCWQLVLMLGYAILFTSVTKPSEMQEALTWFLKPVPFIPERRVATMINLTIRFFPLVLDQHEETQMAIKSRCGGRARKPFERVRHFVLPLFRRSFLYSEEVALALAARGYREDLPIRTRKIPLLHITILGLLTLLVFVAVYGAAAWSCIHG